MRRIVYYVGSRIAWSAITLIGISFVIFVGLQRLLPGSEAELIAGSTSATPAHVRAIEKKLGLLRPILDQYVSWLGHALSGNLGVAPLSGLPVSKVLAQEVPVSFELAFLGLLMAVVIGVTVGVLSAILGTRGRPATDVGMRLPFLVAYATPFFVAGALLLLLSAHYFPSLYSVSYVSIRQSIIGNLQSMALPAVAVGLQVSGLTVQMSRAAMLEILSQPYIVTARACGVRPIRLYGLHALKAAALPILSLIGFMYGILLGGVIVVEQVFSLPGLGRGLLDSITNREFGQLEAQVLVIAAAFVAGNLLVDLISPLFDRRLLGD